MLGALDVASGATGGIVWWMGACGGERSISGAMGACGSLGEDMGGVGEEGGVEMLCCVVDAGICGV